MIGNLADQIPHRPPMHWLDGAQVLADGSIGAWRTIAADHPFVLQGRLVRSALIEMIAQAAACSAASRIGPGPPPQGMLIALREVCFTDAPAVGECVDLHAKMIRSIGNMFLCEAAASVGDRPLLRGKFSFVLL